jgi:thiosulfate/3-mercaptopyruvate sulfurtransferase
VGTSVNQSARIRWVSSFGPLVSAAWLRDHLADEDVKVIDLRWYADGRSGRDAYLAGHLPGAVFVDLDRDITGAEGPGRHPIPSRAQFEEAMQTAGLEPDSRVVVYDDLGGSSAARLWWLLRYYGHREVAVLDGGLPAWEGPLETDSVSPLRGGFHAAEPDREMVVDRDRVRSRGEAVLIDARAADRYRGEVEPFDSKAGHIPGARNVPWRSNLGKDWRFLPPAELRAKYAAAGDTEVIAYCGSGITAAVDLLALEVAGIEGARLYEGSWSDWSRQDLPIATGPEP